MTLTPEQEKALRQWAAEGASLSDLQARLASEFDLHPSYMDVRFLVLDLGIQLAERPKPNPTDIVGAASPAPSAAEPQDAAYPGAPYDDGLGPEDEEQEYDAPPPADSSTSDSSTSPEPEAPAAGSVRVEVSRLARPGFAVTGTVTFSDGVTADWGVTARGELDLVADEAHPNYRPSPKDAQTFMVELRKAITKMGMY